eukprot:Gb_31460 [translate_table: standard]
MASQALAELKGMAPMSRAISLSFLPDLSLTNMATIHHRPHFYRTLVSLENEQKQLSRHNSRFIQKWRRREPLAIVTRSASLVPASDTFRPAINCFGRNRKSPSGLFAKHFSHSALQMNEGSRLPLGPDLQNFIRQAQGLTQFSSEAE